MISFSYENEDIARLEEDRIVEWLLRVVSSESKTLGEVDYILCSDDFLLDLNIRFLEHNTYTDIITFDESLGNKLAGEIYVSVDRVRENASSFNVTYDDELKRVLVHGVLHMCGYKDKKIEEQVIMTQKENEKIRMFHVEH